MTTELKTPFRAASARLQEICVRYWLPLLACALALLVCAGSWPGFMSFDSVLALSQARNGITESGYPPMVSYVWWLTDRIIPGPGGMLLLENLLVFLGLAKIAVEVRAPRKLAAAVLVLLAVAPVTLGSMLVVWKDVAFAGWLALAAGYALAYWRRQAGSDLWLALALTAIATSYRLNAFPAALPILALLGDGLARRYVRAERRKLRWLTMASACGFWSVLMVGIVVGLSSARLPDGQRLTPPHGHHPWTMVGDLVGMSVCSGLSLLPTPLYPPGHEGDVGFLRKVYAPQHAQKTFANFADGVRLDAGAIEHVPHLQTLWWQAVRAQPTCFLWHRWQVTIYLLGLNSGRVFYLTDDGVAPNDLGLTAHPSWLTKCAVDWINREGDGLLARTWFYLLLAAGASAWCLAKRREWQSPLMFLSSALAYLGLGALILPAADARYQFWVIIACLASFLAAMGNASQPLEASR